MANEGYQWDDLKTQVPEVEFDDPEHPQQVPVIKYVMAKSVELAHLSDRDMKEWIAQKFPGFKLPATVRIKTILEQPDGKFLKVNVPIHAPELTTYSVDINPEDPADSDLEDEPPEEVPVEANDAADSGKGL